MRKRPKKYGRGWCIGQKKKKRIKRLKGIGEEDKGDDIRMRSAERMERTGWLFSSDAPYGQLGYRRSKKRKAWGDVENWSQVQQRRPLRSA